LRNFAYVRVKIGCQDLSLIPNTRLAEIKKGFYELQYTRELFEPSPPPAARTAAAEHIDGNDNGQGTPKRQRTGGNDSEAGSQSAPPVVGLGSSSGAQRQITYNNTHRRQVSQSEKGKNHVIEDNSSLSPGHGAARVQTGVSVSQGVVAAVQASRQINSEHLDCDEELLAQRKDPSFQKFICGLTSSSSDKSFHLKKQFSQILPPIVENIAENEDLPDEQVDYGSSGESGESSQATDMPFIPSGTGILALAVPAARQDHAAVVIPVGGSQPEVESTQEEELAS
jgi:hypothetical protein